MNVGTGMHYNNVAAQMHAYLHSPHQMRRSPSPFPGQFGQGGNFAAQMFQQSAQRLGINQMGVNDFGGVARGFMRNLLS